LLSCCEWLQLLQYDLQTGAFVRITADISWNVTHATVSQDGKHIAVQINEDGRDVLRLYNAQTLAPLPLPNLPQGSVGVSEFNPAGTLLAFSINSAQGPSQIFQLELLTSQVTQITQASTPAGTNPASFCEQEIIRWMSFDGRQISGLLSRPPPRFIGKRPVLINIHGGPESQSKIGFIDRQQYFIQELGIALIQPNVRGSTGYGKTFLDLDNGRLRQDSVKDIGSLLDWVSAQPDLDETKILVYGGSYGGYMSLAVAFTYTERIVGAIDVVGISHFVTFLERTESYRRDLRRVKYGDERDPEMRAFLHQISPLTNADKIKKPLFVVQGKNDPRVPYTEAEQIVAKTRSMGTPVWYLRAENEGHGFARQENKDFQFCAMIMFMSETLGIAVPLD
jgi:dipeptidyl aminopeptidase/acylaminoacyl peptidase